MLRSRNPDAENVAPGAITSAQRAHKAGGPPRQSLGPRKQLSGKPRLSVRTPLSERSLNQENNLPSNSGDIAGLSAKHRPKRRALGDITNKGSSATTVLAPTKGLGAVPKHRLKESSRPIPRDEFGRVEEPDIFPDPVPTVYEPPEIDFTEEELDLIRPKDDGCDPFARPRGQLLFDLPLQRGDIPPPVDTGREVVEELGGLLETEMEQVKWRRDDWLTVDDFELELP